MTLAQLGTLKADLLLDPILAAASMNSDGDVLIAQAYNQPAVVPFTVWKTAVNVADILANGFRWTDVDSLTVGKARIWDWMTRLGTLDPSKATIRQGLVDCWGNGTLQAVAITPHLKRLTTRGEKLFATGTGTDAVPGFLTVEGTIGAADVSQARSLV